MKETFALLSATLSGVIIITFLFLRGIKVNLNATSFKQQYQLLMTFAYLLEGIMFIMQVVWHAQLFSAIVLLWFLMCIADTVMLFQLKSIKKCDLFYTFLNYGGLFLILWTSRVF